jgi:hypothetical protein
MDFLEQLEALDESCRRLDDDRKEVIRNVNMRIKDKIEERDEIRIDCAEKDRESNDIYHEYVKAKMKADEICSDFKFYS